MTAQGPRTRRITTLTGMEANKVKLDTAVYAIRCKETGLYLPDRQGRGYSNDEPTSIDRPRLFWKRRSAEMALRAWAKGRWVKKISGGYRFDLGSQSHAEYDEEVVIEPVEGRGLEGMEIVTLTLTLKEAR